MLCKLKLLFSKLFSPVSAQDSLDHFIASQHPTTVSEVEYWISVYERRKPKTLNYLC